MSFILLRTVPVIVKDIRTGIYAQLIGFHAADARSFSNFGFYGGVGGYRPSSCGSCRPSFHGVGPIVNAVCVQNDCSALQMQIRNMGFMKKFFSNPECPAPIVCEKKVNIFGKVKLVFEQYNFKNPQIKKTKWSRNPNICEHPKKSELLPIRGFCPAKAEICEKPREKELLPIRGFCPEKSEICEKPRKGKLLPFRGLCPEKANICEKPKKKEPLPSGGFCPLNAKPKVQPGKEKVAITDFKFGTSVQPAKEKGALVPLNTQAVCQPKTEVRKNENICKAPSKEQVLNMSPTCTRVKPSSSSSNLKANMQPACPSSTLKANVQPVECKKEDICKIPPKAVDSCLLNSKQEKAPCKYESNGQPIAHKKEDICKIPPKAVDSCLLNSKPKTAPCKDEAIVKHNSQIAAKPHKNAKINHTVKRQLTPDIKPASEVSGKHASTVICLPPPVTPATYHKPPIESFLTIKSKIPVRELDIGPLKQNPDNWEGRTAIKKYKQLDGGLQKERMLCTTDNVNVPEDNCDKNTSVVKEISNGCFDVGGAKPKKCGLFVTHGKTCADNWERRNAELKYKHIDSKK